MDSQNTQDMESVETEITYTKSEGEIIEPFDPKAVDIVPLNLALYSFVERLKNNEIVMDPIYQRNSDLWDNKTQSRLIESLIIRIPLPTFYFAASDNDSLIVVDGLQRLSTFKHFMVLDKDDPNRLRLQDLEYLKEFNGKLFEELPTPIQRRIREANITSYVIRKGTPKNVLNSIFKRINTGGLVLTPAEIKNAIYQEASPYVNELAARPEFVEATRNSIKPDRMLDREFVNRFLAFYLLGVDQYKGSLDRYLCDTLEYVQHASSKELQSAKNQFIAAMILSHDMFGGNAFRRLTPKGTYAVINKPLFDCVSVNFAKLSDAERSCLLSKKKEFLNAYENLLKTEDFVSIISMGTATEENVRGRHERIKSLIRNVLNA